MEKKSNIRKHIYDVLEISTSKMNILSAIYNYFMILIIVLSLIPLGFKNTYNAFEIFDFVCVLLFMIDYILRWITADYKFGKHSVSSFIKYPFSFMAIIDLLSIIPTFITALSPVLKILRIFRLLRALRVLRAFKSFRNSKSIKLLIKVMKKSESTLASVAMFVVAYILVSALAIFNVEPESFGNFFDAIYWATISLTTIGYGDVYPVTVLGKVITIISSFFGIAIIALPSGIITARFISEINKSSDKTPDDNADSSAADNVINDKTEYTLSDADNSAENEAASDPINVEDASNYSASESTHL